MDKILSQRKAEREAAEQKAREEKLEADMEALRPKPSAAELEDWKRQLLAVFPDADEGYVERLLASQKENHVNNATNAMLETPYTRKPSQHTSAPAPAPIQPGAAGNRTGSFLSGWKNRFIQRAPEQSSLASGTSSIVEKGGQDFPGGWGEQPAPTPVSASARAMRPQQPDAPSQGVGGGKGPLSSGGRLPDPHAQVTPTSNIKNNVLRAISASRSDSSNVIKTQGQKAEVKEASNTYCDTTAGTDLRLAGEVAGLKVFLSPQLDAIDVLERNADALRRLIDQVYKPVAKIFGLDPRSINVFCDTEGPTIAFNRGGTIYLNLRYYLAWHDELVKKGDLQEPLISTFFTVSHEIAHKYVR